MKWSDVATGVKAIAPGLGALIGGPVSVAATVGSLIASALGTENTPDAVNEALRTDPDAAVKLAQIEADTQKAVVDAEASNMAQVNETMRAEGQSEHWQTYSWRPAIGFSIAINVCCSSLIVIIAYAGVMFFGVDPELLSNIPPMLGAMAAILAVTTPVVGIASYWRGKKQAPRETEPLDILSKLIPGAGR